MAGTTRNLTIMLLPQTWDGADLIANILLLPNGDPTQPLAPASGPELPFASAQPVLRAAVLPGLATPPWAPAISPEFVPVTLAYSTAQSGIFSALTAEYAPAVPIVTQPTAVIRKDLPDSYREATGFQTPDPTFFTAEDGFGCALAAATPSKDKLTPQPIAWGEVFSYALRQPLVAQAMGLMYLSVSIPLTPDQVSGGGWIWIEIDPSNSSNWYAKLIGGDPTAVVSYAARLPVLTAAQDVFAALLFPTVPSTVDGATIDAAQYEADLYLDGFAKIVHAAQPTSSDAVTNDPTHIVPGTDAGVQIGWDDEQVTTWVNRQIAIAQAFATGATPLAELPFTILGYRVDVRELPPAPNPPTSWASLCLGHGQVNAAGVFMASTAAGNELCVEPTPVQNGTPALNADFWLPQYFAQWRGRTLVVNDKYAYAFSGGQPPTASFPPATNSFNGTTTEVLSGIDLRYGNSYQFRTRLTDLTGGGPAPTDDSPADAGITTVDFRRNVPPKKVQLTVGGFDPTGNQYITVDRPLINYPELVFAGAAGSGAAEQATLDALLATVPPQKPFGQPLNPNAPPFQASMLDPDVTTLEIIVEAQAPVHDTGNPCFLADADTPPAHGDLDGTYRVVYTVQVPYPVHTGAFELGASTPIQLVLEPTPMNSIAHPPLIALNSTSLPIPTGRNVRIRMRGLGDPDPNALYFASSIARTGLITDITVRYEAATEADVLVAGNADQQLQAFYLRNLDNSDQVQIVSASVSQLAGVFGFDDPIGSALKTIAPAPSTPSQLLANALQLPLNGLTFSATPGKRTLFGAQSTLRHNVTQDRSQITFSAEKDFINHWIVVHRFTLDRDWTWSGLAQNGPGQTAFSLNGELPDTGPQTLAKIDLPKVVSALATQSNGDPGQRDSTELIFFSTLDANVASGDYPAPATGGYQLTATFTGDPTSPATLWMGSITVPITDQPRQVPQIVSAGIAESPYIAASDYSSTTQRQRALWFEFDTQPDDPNDAYFVRVTNYGVDPLLVSQPFNIPPNPDTPISLDPEPIRLITPDSANDAAGLSAMTQLVASSSSAIHFLVPLPDGIPPTALDLFGFWTYEVRCGHSLWSTAQGRFGRPLRVAGVQHPCPPLTLNVDRTNTPGAPSTITASANLAQTVIDGQSLTSLDSPQTQIWFALYAQLSRADGGAYRNLLLDTAQGYPISSGFARYVPGPLGAITVTASFLESDIADVLEAFLLPPNTPLSVLAVEFFNLEADVVDYQFRSDRARAQTSTKPALAAQEAASATATAAPVSIAEDVQTDNPLGQELGSQRILRTSPLVPVRATC